ncbi:MAG: YjbH domain-containing protein [Alphaproteobacteria bacterium]|nr:YjbH domain-containing protein [Alphaproteobacteria bacterium]
MPFFFKRHTVVPIIFGLILGAIIPAHAQEKEENIYSTSTIGILGLNTIPNARMDKQGTIRAGVSTLDPYMHGYLGFQITPSLYLNFRQTGEYSSLNDSATRVYPGMDVKLRLKEEREISPEISLGLNSAVGHRKHVSEYVAFSKRYKNFDFTGGVAWGRLGHRGHIKNPLRALSSHFENDRKFLSENPNGPENWFTGEDIGFFGGIEYFTPVKGLSLKADYGADDYFPETSSFDYNAPAPWSFGFNYQPWDWIDLSAAVIGGDKIMARASIQEQIQDWRGKNSETDRPPTLKATNAFNKEAFKEDIKTQKFYLKNDEENPSHARLDLTSYRTTVKQIGRAARITDSHFPLTDESITLALHHKGLRGPDINLIRSDLQRAILENSSSTEEIWHDTEIKTDDLIDTKSIIKIKPTNFHFILDTRLSLSEDDVGPLYRTAAIIETEQELPFGFITGAAGRLNLKDNLEDMEFIRGISNLPQGINNKSTRRNTESFTAQRTHVEDAYLSWLHSLNTNTHISFTSGLLEEMFAGIGGEILYRPFGKRYALGAEIWRATPRDPFSTLDTYDDYRTTGFLNAWYELPDKRTTLYGKVGQYLAEDFGATLGIQTSFRNGATLKGFVTGSEQSDRDIFGGDTNIHAGMRLSLPIGNIPFMPDGSAITTTIEPIGRDVGQVLDKPIDLYETTEPLSYRALSRDWSDLLH